MEKISKFVNEIRTVDISLEKHFYYDKTGYIGEARVRKFEKMYRNRKTYFYNINFNDQCVIESLYIDAKFSLASLTMKELKNTLIILQSFRHIEFYNALVLFYIRMKYNEVNLDDEQSLKELILNYFNSNFSLDGRVTDRFLIDLIIQTSYNNRYLDIIIIDINTLLDGKEILQALYIPSNLLKVFDKKELKQDFSNQEQTEVNHESTISGRPPTDKKDASNYLLNKNLLPFLIENYSNVKPRVFNQLIKVLVDLQQLKEAENKEYKEAFGKALNVQQAQFNFDKAFNKAPNPNLFDPIKAKIQTYLGE